MRVWYLWLAIGSTLFVRSVFAAPVAMENAGFEAPYLGGNLPLPYNGDVPATAFPVGAPPAGWEPYGAVGGNAFVGVLNPGVMAVEPLATYFPDGAPEGENVALTFFDGHLGGAEFGIEQTLDAVLEADTRYTLTVEVGNIASGVSVVQPFASFGFFDLRGFPGYRIELLAGGVVVATDNNTLLPEEGDFLTSTVRLDVRGEHEQLGEQLAIRLVNLNQSDVLDPVVDLEVDFDTVALDASPIPYGDFNADGVVDAVDYTVWRNHFGDTNEAAIFYYGDGLNGVDATDYDLWKANYSSTAGSGGLAGERVPETTSRALFLIAAAAVQLLRRGLRIA
jgi:hapalindole H/12-epi-hapalindole U/12-epi-fischerindole U synthase